MLNPKEDELFHLSASEAIFLIKLGKIKITKLIESINKRIEEFNPQTNAWTHLNPSQSLNYAKEIENKMNNGIETGPLHGIPIGVKDIFNTKDFPTEMGSPLWKDFTPGNDARVVYNLQMANAIIIGKTDTAEFAVHSLGNTKNPFDPERSPGSSSSGSAVAVATEMVPIALGTQTGGSIIRPASYCGVYGFKPSFGLIPRTGMLKTTDSLDQVGYFAKTVPDLELIFEIIRVKGRDFPFSEAALENKERQNVTNRSWKIRFVKSPVWNEAESYAKKNVEDFIEKLSKEKEFEITEFDLPQDFDQAHKTHQKIYSKSIAYYFKEELLKKSLVSDIFYDFAMQAKNISLNELNEALEIQNKLRTLLDNSFKNFDIIISLSTAGHAPLRNEKEKDDPSLIWTLCGNPTVNLPVFTTPKGLPMGIQSVARRYNDKLLLNFLHILRKKNFIPDVKFGNDSN